MAINPFAIRDLQLPAPLKTQAIDFSPLQNLGAGIGAYRRQQDIGSILAGATDAQGNLDIMKAATKLGEGGYVREAEDFIQNAIRQQAVKQTGAHQAQTESIARQGLDLRRTEEARQKAEGEAAANLRQQDLEFRKKAHEEGKTVNWTQEHPLGLGPARRFRTTPDGKTIELQPPTAPAATPPAATPGPRSEVPELAPGSVAELPARPGSVGDRFAGMTQIAALGGGPTADTSPQAPATRVAQAGPAPATAGRNEAVLQRVQQQYGPEAATMLKEIIEYKRGIPKDKTERAWTSLALEVDSKFDPSGYESRKARQPPPSYRWRDPNDPDKGMVAITGSPAEKVEAEVAARMGLAKSFLDEIGTQYDAQGRATPGLRERIRSGEMTGGIINPAMAWANFGTGAAEVRRKIDSGADALLRNLTGAGMNKEEAGAYARRYQFGLRDTVGASLSKLDQLERELQYISNEVSRGRGGAAIEILRKSGSAPPPSQWTQEGGSAPPAATPAPPKVTDQDGANGLVGQAKEALKQRPDQYDEIAKRLRDRGVPNPERLLGPRPK